MINKFSRMGLALLFAVVWGFRAHAAPAAWDGLTTPVFMHLAILRELPSAPTAVAQEKSGLIWIATQEGLVRWDGYRGRLFLHDPKDEGSPPADYIADLTVDEQGTLFVATDQRVVRHDPETGRFTALPPLRPGSFGRIKTGRAGELWLTNDEGLWWLATGSPAWRRVDLDGASDIRSFLPGRDGSLWVDTAEGLRRGSSGSGPFEPVSGLSPSDRISALFQASDGAVWAGTSTGQVAKLVVGGPVEMSQLPVSNNGVRGIVELSKGVICVGMDRAGLAFLDSSTGAVLRRTRFDPLRPAGLASNNVIALYVDRAGGLWLAHDHGVDYEAISSGPVATMMPSERDASALSDGNIYAIAALPDGRVWAGLDSGVDLLDPIRGRIRSLHKQSDAVLSDLPNTVRALAPSADGSLWVGTSAGLFEVDGDRIARFEALGTKVITSITAEDNVLWVGLRNEGLARIRLTDRLLTLYTHDPNDPSSVSAGDVNAVLRDQDRGLWVATNNGLDLFDERTGKVRRFTHDDADPASLPSDEVSSLLIDTGHRLWVATEGGGVAVATEKSGLHFRSIGREEGLPDDNVDKLLADDRGRIWASTDSGVAMIDPGTLSVRISHRADSLSVDGYWAGSGARTEDGTLLFGGTGGITVIHPEREEAETYQPPVVVTEVRVGGHHRPPASAVILAPDDHSLQVEFAALDYSAPSRLQYAYRLVGVDDDWVASDADHRLAAYTNVPPGSYRLLLRGSNRLGQWTDPPTDIAVIVLPAWYQTVWFKLVALALGLVSIAALVYGRTLFLLQQRSELEAKVAERTRDLQSATEALTRLATQDGLTQIANRRHFDEVLALEIRRAHRAKRPVSLLLIDVDDFKAYNDSHGHLSGDDVLRHVAALCQARMRRATDLAARYGGDEIALVLPDVDLAPARATAEAIVAEVANAGILHGQGRAAATVTVSIGVATYSGHGDVDSKRLIAAADAALYEAKRSGRNRAVAGETV